LPRDAQCHEQQHECHDESVSQDPYDGHQQQVRLGYLRHDHEQHHGLHDGYPRLLFGLHDDLQEVHADAACNNGHFQEHYDHLRDEGA
jgi:hypothetical protein